MIVTLFCSLTLTCVIWIVIVSQVAKSSPFPGEEVEITGNFTLDMLPSVNTNESMGNGTSNSSDSVHQTNQTNMTATNSTVL